MRRSLAAVGNAAKRSDALLMRLFLQVMRALI
jgi:hypothetical protein